jgi:hypothetical protein
VRSAAAGGGGGGGGGLTLWEGGGRASSRAGNEALTHTHAHATGATPGIMRAPSASWHSPPQSAVQSPSALNSCSTPEPSTRHNLNVKVPALYSPGMFPSRQGENGGVGVGMGVGLGGGLSGGGHASGGGGGEEAMCRERESARKTSAQQLLLTDRACQAAMRGEEVFCFSLKKNTLCLLCLSSC